MSVVFISPIPLFQNKKLNNAIIPKTVSRCWISSADRTRHNPIRPPSRQSVRCSKAKMMLQRRTQEINILIVKTYGKGQFFNTFRWPIYLVLSTACRSQIAIASHTNPVKTPHALCAFLSLIIFTMQGAQMDALVIYRATILQIWPVGHISYLLRSKEGDISHHFTPLFFVRCLVLWSVWPKMC